MAIIERSIDIKAPLERVFSYITDPANRVEWIPDVSSIRNTSGSGKGQKWDYTYKMHGIPIKGKVEVTEYIQNKRYSHKNNRGFAKNWSYDFQSTSEGTRLTVTVEMVPYSLPFVGKIGEEGMIKSSEKNADIAVSNIKKNLEK
jgi:carbon monoxide dehydrogenase subunit G